MVSIAVARVGLAAILKHAKWTHRFSSKKMKYEQKYEMQHPICFILQEILQIKCTLYKMHNVCIFLNRQFIEAWLPHKMFYNIFFACVFF